MLVVDRDLSPGEQAAVGEAIESVERVIGRRIPPGRTVHLPLTVWLDRETLLVRRVESGTATDLAREETVVTCQPEADPDLYPGELLFDPPPHGPLG